MLGLGKRNNSEIFQEQYFTRRQISLTPTNAASKMATPGVGFVCNANRVKRKFAPGWSDRLDRWRKSPCGSLRLLSLPAGNILNYLLT